LIFLRKIGNVAIGLNFKEENEMEAGWITFIILWALCGIMGREIAQDKGVSFFPQKKKRVEDWFASLTGFAYLFMAIVLYRVKESKK